ncbi:MAG TPA: flippase [Solirubrobacteraceae bacterium]|jgi:O-antigen/teichoic acid export membrane protein|nr:flippase [Solirubrobacteraceae bacterium]
MSVSSPSEREQEHNGNGAAGATDHERLLELARRLQVVVRELARHAREEHSARVREFRTGQLKPALPTEIQGAPAVFGGDIQPAPASYGTVRERVGAGVHILDHIDGTPPAATAAAGPPDEEHAYPPDDGAGDARVRAGARSSRILLNAGFRAAADVGSKLATAALYVFIGRKLGATQFGIFSFALSFVTLVTALGYFGQDIVLAREVSKDRSQLEKYYSNAMLARSLFSVPPLLIVALILWAGGMSEHTLIVVLLLGLGFTGDYMVQVPFAVFQAYERAEFIAAVLIAQRWITTAVAITALYLHVGLIGVTAIYCAGSAFAAALGTVMMYRYIARPRLHINFRGALDVTREAFPIGIAFVALAILFRIDMTMLAIFKPASEVGQYNAAYKLLETTAFFSWAVNVAVLPSLARLTPYSTPTVGFVFQRGLKLLLAITLPVAVGAIVLADPLVQLVWGSEFHKAGKALALLAPTIPLFAIASLSAQLFFAQGRRPTVAIVYAVVAVENIVVNLILIPRFSLLGAAAGTSGSELLVAGALLVLARRWSGHLELRRMLGGPVLASAVAGTVMFTLRNHLAAAMPLGVAVYLLILFSWERVAFPDDFSVARIAAEQLHARFGRTPVAEQVS